MLLFSIIVGITSVGSFVMTSAGGGDPASSQLTPMSSFAVSLWFGTIVVATVVAVLNRKPWSRELGGPEDYRQPPWNGFPR